MEQLVHIIGGVFAGVLGGGGVLYAVISLVRAWRVGADKRAIAKETKTTKSIERDIAIAPHLLDRLEALEAEQKVQRVDISRRDDTIRMQKVELESLKTETLECLESREDCRRDLDGVRDELVLLKARADNERDILHDALGRVVQQLERRDGPSSTLHKVKIDSAPFLAAYNDKERKP